MNNSPVVIFVKANMSSVQLTVYRTGFRDKDEGLADPPLQTKGKTQVLPDVVKLEACSHFIESCSYTF